jgi:hypothetical protein
VLQANSEAALLVVRDHTDKNPCPKLRVCTRFGHEHRRVTSMAVHKRPTPVP